MSESNGQAIAERFDWWNSLRHGGMLVDAARLSKLIPEDPPSLSSFELDRLRRRIVSFDNAENAERGKFVSYVFDAVCGFGVAGQWSRGNQVDPEKWSRRTITGDIVKPNHLWQGLHGGVLPVFIDSEKRVGVGRGKRLVAQALQWLRAGDESLAIVTNGRQWRLVMAGLDYEAFCEWDIDRWLESGTASAELLGLRSLLAPPLWTPPNDDASAPLLDAIQESRKGQAELSQVLGERVRQAVEQLIQAHSPLLDEHDNLDHHDVYRAGVRLIMRLVVGLFAESREGLLPKDNPVFHDSYSLQGLRDHLERVSPIRRKNGFSAYPRIISLFHLIYEGCSHEALPVPTYGGQLFQPGNVDDSDGVSRALAVLEQGCFGADVVSDAQVYAILDLLSRTKVKIRQGRASTWMPSPVDFSSLDSEYIGILYEGLLDFELRVAGENNPVIFLAVGNQPALPLSTLEAMDDKALKNLLEKMKDTSSDGGEEEEEEPEELEEEAVEQEAEEEDEEEDEEGDDEEENDDVRQTTRVAAEQWARRAIKVGKLVKKPRGRMTPEKELQWADAIDRKASQVITKVILPGERYLVRWGGTRKGSGTFYTRPQLAVPTVHRTLRPLAYDPPKSPPLPPGEVGLSGLGEGSLDDPDADAYVPEDAPLSEWTPKRPEKILDLKVCDPACGSGSFPLAALRFLTEALYNSLVHHDRLRHYGDRTVIDLIRDENSDATLADETLPCRPEDNDFESRTKAVLRRYIVERCIYGVDLDPLAVELCRLSLWIETLDPRLPFTFLDHKIKCGNSLIGTWFDQFMHYPAMAWMREGGDKNHSNGVHFPKASWTRALIAFKARVKPDLIALIDGGRLISSVDINTVSSGHDAAEVALAQIHALGIAQVEQRAARYQNLVESQEFQDLKAAFDLWCSFWFWPADELDHAPFPTQFAAGDIDDDVRRIVRRIANEERFFHWELEFPDVFNSRSHGFDGILGNPPWETLQPNSKEFFSSVDPLYRSYSKQKALQQQKRYFESDANIERDWLAYNASFKAIVEWVKHAGSPFGDRVHTSKQGKESHEFNLGDRGRSSFSTSERRHSRWKKKREESRGFADADHSFRHQGAGKAYTYKMFVEHCYTLLDDHGRLGLIVPSGLYNDHGTRALRLLLLDHCEWEWFFGFENRDGIFDIHGYFKFGAMIIRKGGQTNAIYTAFMRRQLSDWERGEEFATVYPRERINQFSASSLAILEIQSQRDLEVLTKIYSNSVTLGDHGESGWGIRIAQGDFNMTSDSKLFPPRQKWEEWGYLPDEYSRWIKGPWQPIEKLYDQLNLQCLADGEHHCAQPPYDQLHVPRVEFPEGVILSRNATHYVREHDIPTVTFTDASGKPLKIKVDNENGERHEIEATGPAISLPLIQGGMLGHYDSMYQGFAGGSGHSVRWDGIDWPNKFAIPQYLLGAATNIGVASGRITYRYIGNDTNTRTMIASISTNWPAGHTVGILNSCDSYTLLGIINSLAFDYEHRIAFSGSGGAGAMDPSKLVTRAVPTIPFNRELAKTTQSLNDCSTFHAADWLSNSFSTQGCGWRQLWSVTPLSRLETRIRADAITGAMFGLDNEDFRWITCDCDHPLSVISNNRFARNLRAKGFWRVDNDRHPEHRHTVLSLVAFLNLQEQIASSGGDMAAGIEAFCTQNDGAGWQLPETLRLADYGLGHDERAKEHQPVRECFGPRFYDWQLEQTPEESWQECHLHARNLLGPAGYQALLDEIEGKTPDTSKPATANEEQLEFNKKDHPLFVKD